MTLHHARRPIEQDGCGGVALLSFLQEGQDNAQRLSLHACLLERRLRGGAEPADLLVLVQDIKFAVEELQALFRSAMQTVTPALVDPQGAAHAPATITPLRTEVVELSPLLTRCAAFVQQQAKRRGIFLLCDIASDLPSLTTDPEVLAQVFSLLFEHVVRASGKGGLEVRVRWTEGLLVIDIYDAGRGISQKAYLALRDLVGALQGTLILSRELGMRSRVELSLPPAPVWGNGAPQVAPINK